MSEKDTNSEEFSCEMCDETYESETELPFHKRKCHKNDIQGTDKNICWICLKFFETKEAVIAHIKVCHLYSAPNARRIEREIFICYHCPQLFFKKTFLINHIKFFHMSRRFKHNMSALCHICNEEKPVRKLWYHWRMHKVLSISSCLLCYKKCKSLKDLAIHQEQHTHYFHCDMCGFDTKKRSNFLEHIYNHDRKAEYGDEKIDFDEKERCFMPENEMNPLKISSINSIQSLVGVKLPADIRICILCREICTSEDEMIQHHKSHKLLSIVKNIKKYYICECGQDFPNNILLRQHKLQEQKEKLAELELQNTITIRPPVQYSRRMYNSSKKRPVMEKASEEQPKRTKPIDITVPSFDAAVLTKIAAYQEDDDNVAAVKIIDTQDGLIIRRNNDESEGSPLSLNDLRDEDAYIMYVVEQ